MQEKYMVKHSDDGENKISSHLCSHDTYTKKLLAHLTNVPSFTAFRLQKLPYIQNMYVKNILNDLYAVTKASFCYKKKYIRYNLHEGAILLHLPKKCKPLSSLAQDNVRTQTTTATATITYHLTSLFLGDHSRLGQVTRRIFGYCWNQLYYTLDGPPVTELIIFISSIMAVLKLTKQTK